MVEAVAEGLAQQQQSQLLQSKACPMSNITQVPIMINPKRVTRGTRLWCVEDDAMAKLQAQMKADNEKGPAQKKPRT